MPFDGITLAAVAAQLSEALSGGKIEKIYQPEHDEILLHVNARKEKRILYISSNSANPRANLTEERGSYPQTPPGFCMLLRKHLQGGRVTKVGQRGSERVLEISVDTVNELGFSQNKRLIVEIMGKHSNIILIDSNSNVIIDSIKRLTYDVNRHRQTLPGCPYVEPPSQGKTAWKELGRDGFLRAVREALAWAEGVPAGAAGDGGREASSESWGEGCFGAAERLELCRLLSKGVADNVQGFSRQAADAFAERVISPICDRLSTSEQAPPDFADSVGEAAWREFALFVDAVDANAFDPRVYIGKGFQPIDFHAFPLAALEEGSEAAVSLRGNAAVSIVGSPDLGGLALSFDDMSRAIEYYYSNKSATNRVRQKASDLTKALAAGLDKLYLKTQRISEDLRKAEEAETYRLYGELLTAALHLLKPGEKSASVANYYDGSQIEVSLDPRLSPAQNAQRYYKLYAKAKTAAVEKRARLEETARDVEYLKSIQVYVENASSAEELDALRTELTEAGFMRRRKAPTAKRAEKAAPWAYQAVGGRVILAGRNNSDNDALTFKKASAKDLWFHTKDIPGSHVILRTDGAEPGEEAIFQAAAVAAWHSAARASENVPVDYTLVKFVKKPSGAKPGMVVFTNNRTVYVKPGLPG
ncbi:MAG: NFACT family protein [Clostridiales Family XIII bacterium]|jgi:predicted ribosome quality control (RQC) complex YloA/Tae2 family protein|nr:NFACT family protein [Clostridiales Family XIII bacterium]